MTQSSSQELPYLASLNDAQRKAVTFPPQPLLVLAGPGSGKTRILTHRVAWLIQQQKSAPDNILAVTFTNRAANEMRERLDAMLGDEVRAVWTVTFHAAAARILRRFGQAINIPSTFNIIDDTTQKQLLARLIWEAGLSQEKYRVGAIAHSISHWKSQIILGLDNPTIPDPTVAELARRYEETLQQRASLDFDDLIRYAVLLLRHHEDVRQHFHKTLRHILVDEYQDINDSQYELLKLLAPLDSSITVVADADQSIYGWRGSQPELIEAYRERYHPTIIELDRSYRCPPNILYGAQNLLARHNEHKQRRFLRSEIEKENPIFHYIFSDIAQEQRWLVTLIRKLISERGHKPGDIGILYRTHRLADPIEQTLLQAGFKVHRLRKESFFDQSTASDIIRYLQMLRALHTENFDTAVNFPRRVIDELTMVQLQRLADIADISLVDLARTSEQFPEISPLSRRYLKRFTEILAQETPDLQQPATQGLEKLFTLFAYLRSPWRGNDASLLDGFMAFTDYLSPAAEQLAAAIAQQRPVIILHPDTVDGAAAAVILQHALADYLQVEAERHAVRNELPELATDAALVALGPEIAAMLAERPDELIAITPPQPDKDPYCLSIHAWRCAQLLLISYETLADGRFAVYDLETTGVYPQRDEIVEIAARIYENQEAKEEPFTSFVRPARGYIPRAATKVHGIKFEDVADAPTIAQILPDFLDYIDNDTVVGHNITRFDNRFIDAAMGELYDGRGFTPYYIDTLLLARRLLPERNRYTLELLIQDLDLGNKVEHRAQADIEMTASLFYDMCERLLDEKERESLSEYLPWVAVGMLASEIPLRDETAALLDGAARVLQSARQGAAWWEQPFAGEIALEVSTLLRRIGEHSLPQTAEDAEWQALRKTFMDHAEAFMATNPDASLAAFLDYVALLQSVDTFDLDRDPDAITMMTLHNAKGSEFPVVIIIGVEQDNLPLWRTQDNPEQIAEERRVLYVGITRAQEAVYLFSTRDRHDKFTRNPSPFVFDIPPQYIRRFRINRKGRVKEL